MKREKNFELVRERVLERVGDAGAPTAFDKMVEDKLGGYAIFSSIWTCMPFYCTLIMNDKSS